MSRLILLFAVIAIVYWLLKSYRRSAAASSQDKPPVSEDMVRCVQCGVHLPKSESILASGKFYCSDEHRRAHTDLAK